MLSITLIVMPFQGFSVTNLYKYHSASGKIAHPHGISLNASGILIFPIRINILNLNMLVFLFKARILLYP